MVEKACRGITGVSESSVEMNSGLQFYDGITTQEIQKILVKSASDLISLESQTINLLPPDFYYLQFRNKYSIRSGKMQRYTHHSEIS